MATQVQAAVGGSLAGLGLKSVEQKDGIVGGDQKFQITEEFLKMAEEASEQGKLIVLHSNGTFEVE